MSTRRPLRCSNIRFIPNRPRRRSATRPPTRGGTRSPTATPPDPPDCGRRASVDRESLPDQSRCSDRAPALRLVVGRALPRRRTAGVPLVPVELPSVLSDSPPHRVGQCSSRSGNLPTVASEWVPRSASAVSECTPPRPVVELPATAASWPGRETYCGLAILATHRPLPSLRPARSPIERPWPVISPIPIG